MELKLNSFLQKDRTKTSFFKSWNEKNQILQLFGIYVQECILVLYKYRRSRINSVLVFPQTPTYLGKYRQAFYSSNGLFQAECNKHGIFNVRKNSGFY